MKIALYARVSTDTHHQDPLTQLLPLRDYAAHRGHEIVEEYVDHGYKGDTVRRPSLDRLMEDARKKRFDMIVVWRFDRVFRSVVHMLKLAAELKALGLQFVSLTEAIDTSSAVGEMVFVILAAVAQMEKRLIQERVTAGVARARHQGKTLGRPRALIDGEKVCAEFARGDSINQLAKRWGVSRGVIQRELVKRGVRKPQ